jgi:hypothetical protein
VAVRGAVPCKRLQRQTQPDHEGRLKGQLRTLDVRARHAGKGRGKGWGLRSPGQKKIHCVRPHVPVPRVGQGVAGMTTG